MPSYAFYTNYRERKEVDTPWGREVDLDRLQKIFVLLHLNQNHWALGILDTEMKAFEIYDSINKRKTYEEVPYKNALVNHLMVFF